MNHPLAPAIEAVPQAMTKVADWDAAKRVEQGGSLADLIGSAGDVLGMDEKRARRTEVKPAELTTAITTGLAVLAQRPAGVTFAGLHWCTGDHGCPGPGGFDLPDSQIGRSARGAYFTPRTLAEEVSDGAIEALSYSPGPLDTSDRSTWRLKPSSELLVQHVADIAVGSGVFLLAACRYLAARVCEAWHLEAGQPVDSRTPAAMALHARKLVMESCLYGVDIDPASVELTKLSLALLAPTVPVDLTRKVIVGDSLLGITSWAQIERMHLDPSKPPIFTAGEMQFLMKAPILGGVSALLPFALADLVVGAALKSAGGGGRAASLAFAEAAMAGRSLVQDPGRLDQVAAMTQEWLNIDNPEGSPPRRPLHWPLVFPEVFGHGAAGLPAVVNRGGRLAEAA